MGNWVFFDLKSGVLLDIYSTEHWDLESCADSLEVLVSSHQFLPLSNGIFITL